MARKTGDLRREQQPRVRPAVAGMIRESQRDKRRTRRDRAAEYDRRTPSIIAQADQA